MSYNIKQIAHELSETALGNSYNGNALYVARDFPNVSYDEKQMLGRWLQGRQTGLDFHALQSFSIALIAKEPT